MVNGPNHLKNTTTGPIAWMTRNHVTANLCMLLFIVGGLVFASRIKQEVFPEVDLEIVEVSVIYPAASPSEVELGILLSIEDEVLSIDGVKRVTSTAIENRGVVHVELLEGIDSSKALQDVKNRIDSIKSFPEDAERPIVQLLEPRKQVVSVIVYGDQDIRTLRKLVESYHDQLIQLPGVTLVDVSSVPNYEIAIEVSLDKLRNYNLTLEQIADIIRRTAVTIPAGGIKTSGGEILLRTQERREYAREFSDIPIITNPDGSNVLLGDIADLRDTFEETSQESFFNGKSAIKIDVFRVGDQTPLQVSEEVKEFVKKVEASLPEGVNVITWNDRSDIYKDRIDLLMRNALLGLCLVLILLAIFLEPRLAFWVTLGIPVSIIGSFIFIPFTGATINMVSLFAFIVTLGIIVDDAIVVGENIYQKREKGMSYLKASIVGAQEISVSVFFSVMTNIAAFLPLFFIPGATGKIFLQIPSIVISVFIVSFVESLFVLPAHLSKKHKETKFMSVISKPSRMMDRFLKRYTATYFQSQLKIALKHRYLTVCSFISIFIVFVGLVISGFIPFSYLPRVDSDLVSSQVVLPFGVPLNESRRVQEQLVEAAKEVMAEIGGSNISKGIFSQIGSPLGSSGAATAAATIGVGPHLVGAQVFLVSSDLREISGVEFAKKWKEKVGQLPGVESISFDATIQSGEGMPINIEMSHPSRYELEMASKEMAQILSTYKGVSEVDDGVSKGKPQLSFKIKPTARSLGLTAGDLARQVRSAFYGAEALRQQRGRHEIKVLVKFPKEERESLETIEKLVILTPNKGEISFTEAVDVKAGHAYTDIKRADGRRVLAVTADVDESIGNANQIIADIQQNVIPVLESKFQGLTYTLQGQLRAQKESLEAMGVGFVVALVAIYVMLAIPFKSYIQPLIVMLSIPFGLVGALIGHMILGYELSIISIFGLVALSGVVVNDSLVLVVTTNRIHRKGAVTAFEAIMQAAVLRFRPILLTSLTTFFGLSPMIFEKSMQARFLIPMAISLGFGVLFATFIILLVVPAVYLIIVDVKKYLKINK